jgi:hypothetical protein
MHYTLASCTPTFQRCVHAFIDWPELCCYNTTNYSITLTDVVNSAAEIAHVNKIMAEITTKYRLIVIDSKCNTAAGEPLCFINILDIDL